VEQKYERQSDRNFGRSHCENKQKHYLTVGLPPPGASRDECQAARIEHDLNAQEREDEVPPRQKPGETQREQNCRQNQRVLHRYLWHAVPPLL
jgi:hypothetical protein